MDWRYCLTALLLCHVVADFGVRREILSRDITAPPSRVLLHLVVFVVAGAVLLCPAGAGAMLAVLLAGLLHFLIDGCFINATTWSTPVDNRRRVLFVVQQGLKVLLLAVTTRVICGIAESSGLYPQHESLVVLPWLAAALGYAFSIFAGDAFVCLVLTAIPAPSQEGAPGAGRLIGVFEAVLVTTFVIGHQYAAVGLVLAAKSLARFEWLKRQEMAEYMLIGTLANLTCSVAGGLLALSLMGAPLFAP